MSKQNDCILSFTVNTQPYVQINTFKEKDLQ